jgi:hypothetical protein
MRLFTTFFIFLFASSTYCYSQFLIPGEGIMDVRLGADWDEIEWELGFKGKKISKAEVPPEFEYIATKSNIDFDYVVSYQHIMWLPVSDLFFKDDKVCLIQLSSYPEYNMMLCADIGTMEGLNFWDGPEEVKELYDSIEETSFNSKTYYIDSQKGFGLEMLNNETRAMFIFQPQME